MSSTHDVGKGRKRARILVLGFGNPGRADDGLGPKFVERIEALELPGVTTSIDYQLNIEHADLVAQHEIVVFADAATDAEDAFYLRAIEPASNAPTVSSHHVPPAAILGLARDCYDAHPRAFVVGLRAHDLDRFHEGLTEEAERNLERALAHLVPMLAGDRSFPD
ncbi:MAG: hydrogenase maturation protease [Deltaproteobacteria bacterium]|nr:hydrogenase maturation protease [Deltaproteobacteria bacterium]